jgi:hypothetical protein
MDLSEKNSYPKELYSQPKVTSVSLKNESALVEFCKDKSFSVQELKDLSLAPLFSHFSVLSFSQNSVSFFLRLTYRRSPLF